VRPCVFPTTPTGTLGQMGMECRAYAKALRCLIDIASLLFFVFCCFLLLGLRVHMLLGLCVAGCCWVSCQLATGPCFGVWVGL
jgi:hypothetical protein